jgi:uncharacterized protein
MILYLHGFRSSPRSTKARLMATHMQELGRAQEFVCPQLSASPKLAVAQAESIIQNYLAIASVQTLTLIGSSLGGLYATWLAEKYGCKAVMLNPCAKPPLDLQRYVGVSTVYGSDELFEFKAEYVDELKAFAVESITLPERYFLIAATCDEVLDWHEMVAHFASARQLVIEGSDHGISEFSQYLESVVAFCDA